MKTTMKWLKMNKTRFLEIYNRLSEEERKDTCCYITNRPFSWRTCFIEITQNTNLGKNLLTAIPYYERQRRLI